MEVGTPNTHPLPLPGKFCCKEGPPENGLEKQAAKAFDAATSLQQLGQIVSFSFQRFVLSAVFLLFYASQLHARLYFRHALAHAPLQASVALEQALC